jgi:glycosyltransferase involved in cell wall biosynthesis
MKVVLLNTFSGGGGAAIAAARLQEALLAKGIEVSRLCVDENNAEKKVVKVGNEWTRWLHFFKERLAFRPHEKNKSVRYQFSPAVAGNELASHPLIKAADIVHLHWINQGFLSIEELGRIKKPVVWTLHDMWPFTGGCHYSGDCTAYTMECGQCPFLAKPSARDLSFKVWARKASLLPPNLTIVGCSQWMAQLAGKSSLFRYRRIAAIPNPIDLNQYKVIPQAEARKALGLPIEGTAILFAAAAKSDPRKGFRFIEQALESLSKEGKLKEDTYLVSLGKGAQEEIQGIKHFALGRLQDTETINRFYASGDALIVPSLEDNLPNTIMEALASGTPVIGFKTGGIPEMILDNETGWLIDKEDVNGLASSIDLLQRVELKPFREKARQFCETHYEASKVATKYLELFQELKDGCNC